MNRTALKRLLAEAVRRGAVTEAEAARILSSFDDGSLDISRLPPEVVAGLEGDGPLVASAAIAAALILLARSKAPRRQRWTYDAKARRFIAPKAVRIPKGATVAGSPVVRAGEAVSPEQVRAVVDHVIESSEGEVLALGRRLAGERLSLARWYAELEEMIASRHIAAAGLAAGGLGRLTDGDREFIRASIEEQFTALDAFARDIARGRYGRPPQGGEYEARLAQYHRAFRQMYEDMRGRVAKASGADLEQWFLGAADHCRTKVRMGCVERAAKGKVPIDSVPGQGRCTCLQNCHCFKRYYQSGARGAAA